MNCKYIHYTITFFKGFGSEDMKLLVEDWLERREDAKNWVLGIEKTEKSVKEIATQMDDESGESITPYMYTTCELLEWGGFVLLCVIIFLVKKWINKCNSATTKEVILLL